MRISLTSKSQRVGSNILIGDRHSLNKKTEIIASKQFKIREVLNTETFTHANNGHFYTDANIHVCDISGKSFEQSITASTLNSKRAILLFLPVDNFQ